MRGEAVMERIGEAFELDERLTILGRQLRAGDLAPDFALESFDPETEAMRVVRLGDTSGRVRLLNVVNSVDTPVCHIETRRWDGLNPTSPMRSCCSRRAWTSPSPKPAGAAPSALVTSYSPPTKTRASARPMGCC